MIVNVVQVVDAAAIAQPHQEGGKAGASTELCRRVIGEASAKIERAAGRGGLENGELFAPNIGPELEGVIAAHPAKILRQAISILHLMRRQERGTANLRDVVKGQLWKAAVPRHIRNPGKATGKIQQHLAGLVRVDLMAL